MFSQREPLHLLEHGREAPVARVLGLGEAVEEPRQLVEEALDVHAADPRTCPRACVRLPCEKAPLSTGKEGRTR